MFKNSKKQGDWGVGAAIAHYSKLGHTILIPLTDSQDYDLVVDVEGKLQRIQVKTTTYKNRQGNYTVSLTTKGGNRSYNTIKKMDKAFVDQIFIITKENEIYIIPSDKIGQSAALSSKYEIFKV